jgi:hypothetical protein
MGPGKRALFTLALMACSGGSRSTVSSRGAHAHAVLPSLDGGDLDLASYRGQVVVLHFFTTWSLAAQVDLGELRRVREALAPGSVVIVGVGLDPDGSRLLRPWRDAAQADWPIVLPSEEVMAGESGFGRIQVVPTTIVLDGGGQVVWRHEGGLPRDELLGVVRRAER